MTDINRAGLSAIIKCPACHSSSWLEVMGWAGLAFRMRCMRCKINFVECDLGKGSLADHPTF